MTDTLTDVQLCLLFSLGLLLSSSLRLGLLAEGTSLYVVLADAKGIPQLLFLGL